MFNGRCQDSLGPAHLRTSNLTSPPRPFDFDFYLNPLTPYTLLHHWVISLVLNSSIWIAVCHSSGIDTGLAKYSPDTFDSSLIRHHVYPSILVNSPPLPPLGLAREACDLLLSRDRLHGPGRAGRLAPASPGSRRRRPRAYPHVIPQ